jgi:hypothetical protein
VAQRVVSRASTNKRASASCVAGLVIGRVLIVGKIFSEITRLIWRVHTVSKSLFDVRGARSHVLPQSPDDQPSFDI